MPLYRRGPGFLARPLSPATAWPLQHAYGPPDDREGRAAGELDLPLFSLYFLLAETLATFVGYRIAQHCLRGCRVWFLSPTARMWIGVCYCSLKISLIDYAFHDSAYFKCSLLIMVWYFVYAVLALGFHFGPLQFLFFDYIPRSKMTRSLYHRAALVCQQVSSRLEFYVLQRWLSLPPVLDDATAVVPAAAVSQPAQSIASPPPAGFSRVVGFFGRVVEVHIAQWNLSVCHQWAIALASGGRGAAARLDGVPDCFEARFIFMMQRDGLLLGFFLMSPSATLLLKLRCGGEASPFEVVLRFHCRSRAALMGTAPRFLYAESPLLVGRSTQPQRTAIYEALCALNATSGYSVDVPLCSLRCKNFVDAGVGRVIKKARRQGLLKEMENFL